MPAFAGKTVVRRSPRVGIHGGAGMGSRLRGKDDEVGPLWIMQRPPQAGIHGGGGLHIINSEQLLRFWLS